MPTQNIYKVWTCDEGENSCSKHVLWIIKIRTAETKYVHKPGCKYLKATQCHKFHIMLAQKCWRICTDKQTGRWERCTSFHCYRNQLKKRGGEALQSDTLIPRVLKIQFGIAIWWKRTAEAIRAVRLVRTYRQTRRCIQVLLPSVRNSPINGKVLDLTRVLFCSLQHDMKTEYENGRNSKTALIWLRRAWRAYLGRYESEFVSLVHGMEQYRFGTASIRGGAGFRGDTARLPLFTQEAHIHKMSRGHVTPRCT